MATETLSAAVQTDEPEQLNLYDLFIGILTVLSLTGSALQLLLPVDAAAQQVLRIVDSLYCVIFLGDFVGHLVTKRREQRRDRCLDFNPAMIAADGNAHRIATTPCTPTHHSLALQVNLVHPLRQVCVNLLGAAAVLLRRAADRVGDVPPAAGQHERSRGRLWVD